MIISFFLAFISAFPLIITKEGKNFISYKLEEIDINEQNQEQKEKI